MPIVRQSSPVFRARPRNYQINPGLRIVARGRRGLGAVCPSGLVQVANGGCCDPTNPSPACSTMLASSSRQAQTYSQAPGCYVINLAQDECEMQNGYPLKCSAIRECDPLTGQQHCQFPLPGQTDPSQTANPSIPFCTSGANALPFSTPSTQEQQTLTGGTAFTPSGVDVAALTTAAVKAATQANQQSSQQSGSISPAVTDGSAPSGDNTGQSNSTDPSLALPTSVTNFYSGSTDTSGDWISGIPNWVLIGGGVLLLGGILLLSGHKR